MGKRILGESYAHPAITSAPPVGNVGIDMTQFHEAARPQWWHLLITVTSGSPNIFIWGLLPLGPPADSDNAAGDVWLLHQDEYKVIPLGQILAACPNGSFGFMTDGLGIYSRIYIQASAGTPTAVLSEILEAGRGC